MINLNKLKKIVILIALILIGNIVHAQYYVSIMPALTSATGTIQDRGNISMEFGKQWDCFSLGIDAGETNFSFNPIKDKTMYFECRPNLNIFQQGKFTNTITTGIGVIPSANESLLIELTSGIEYSYSELLHINIMVGQFNYSGIKSNSSQPFFGLSFVRYFKAYNPTSITSNLK